MSAEQPIYQVMPLLTEDEYAALRADIDAHGVLTPIVKDQHGNVLDGHHRMRIAVELGIKYRVDTVIVQDAEDARDLAFSLNLARRHLTREQKRDLIKVEIERRPEESDRSIARRLHCSPSTVGAVRQQVSNLDTSKTFTAEDFRRARDLTDRCQEALFEMDKMVLVGLLKGASPLEMTGALVTAFRRFEAEQKDNEIVDILRVVILGPRLDDLISFPASGWYANEGREIAKLMEAEEAAAGGRS